MSWRIFIIDETDHLRADGHSPQAMSWPSAEREKIRRRLTNPSRRMQEFTSGDHHYCLIRKRGLPCRSPERLDGAMRITMSASIPDKELAEAFGAFNAASARDAIEAIPLAKILFTTRSATGA